MGRTPIIVAALASGLIGTVAAADSVDVMLKTPAGIQLASWCKNIEDAACRQSVADQAQSHCQGLSRSNAQLVSSTLVERSMFKGERFFFIFNCVR